MSLKDEFKAFILRGNVIDLAVGVVVGASFGNIVKSLVDDVLMPPIGLLLGGVDFSNIFLTLKDGAAGAPENGYATLAAAKAAGAVTMNIGVFLNSVLSFLIVATAIFGVVKVVNKLQSAALKKEKDDADAKAAEPAPTPEDIVLLREIRDALAKRG
ncbi:large conductance mechanosensitive channel protein MscL [Alysiella filiformis]|uniref:Large-conductance mechanosensitive channel n=1 Tax=Alysiella filiformis DSM 16848 TaxID=1120981 RepID=A0A286E1H4_9NEIS|nr:large conductance mechanosensitive channel protein MscL [Alysiella filiformis]QMT30737.1 large conductance mechanosensitive channel protein MscL [Alysiella filiformis]UBQ56283.1 large conductance mechanosensitive channel protein MscL [Alysiella filiformis DSM 16848]SOD64741.1 large conductance mechanosensitive channel [Alysiella filiformis DSM 16848]